MAVYNICSNIGTHFPTCGNETAACRKLGDDITLAANNLNRKLEVEEKEENLFVFLKLSFIFAFCFHNTAL